MTNNIVSIAKAKKAEYPEISTLFRPNKRYPEYPFTEISSRPNYVYEAVRECLRLQGLDAENYGKPCWNPFKDVIQRGACILIKPNLVIDRNSADGDIECLYTQPAVVASIIDYIILAGGYESKIVIGDAPIQECDFSNLLETSGYQKLVDFYQNKGYNVSIVDFRELTAKVVNGIHVTSINENADGTVINLGENSEFSEVAERKQKRMRITNYDPRILQEHHNALVHEYYISNYVLRADVIFNMPKPKTHRKAGATISLKNFVGANIRKEYLPHHTKGSIAEGGDEYDRENLIHGLRSNLCDIKNCKEAQREYKKAWLIKQLIRACSIGLKLMGNKFEEGSWYGNHTISKTVSDINKIIYYANKEGIMRPNKQRQVIIVADMIKAGEGEGPIFPTSKVCGIIAMGTDPVCFDEIIATIMGFDCTKIPTIINARNVASKYRFAGFEKDAITVSNVEEFDQKTVKDIQMGIHYNFEPAAGWKGHIEI